MKFLAEKSKQIEKLFEKGKPLEKLYPLFEALDTFLLTPGKTTKKAPHARDAIDIKRVMIFVVIALIPWLAEVNQNIPAQDQIHLAHSGIARRIEVLSQIQITKVNTASDRVLKDIALALMLKIGPRNRCTGPTQRPLSVGGLSCTLK